MELIVDYIARVELMVELIGNHDLFCPLVFKLCIFETVLVGAQG